MTGVVLSADSDDHTAPQASSDAYECVPVLYSANGLFRIYIAAHFYEAEFIWENPP